MDAWDGQRRGSAARAAAEDPVACTLDADARGERVQAWHDLLGLVRERQPLEGGIRLVFTADVPAERLASLAVAEQACCSFFSFTITIDGRGLTLEVRAPAAGQPALTSLFGTA